MSSKNPDHLYNFLNKPLTTPEALLTPAFLEQLGKLIAVNFSKVYYKFNKTRLRQTIVVDVQSDIVFYIINKWERFKNVTAQFNYINRMIYNKLSDNVDIFVYHCEQNMKEQLKMNKSMSFFPFEVVGHNSAAVPSTTLLSGRATLMTDLAYYDNKLLVLSTYFDIILDLKKDPVYAPYISFALLLKIELLNTKRHFWWVFTKADKFAIKLCQSRKKTTYSKRGFMTKTIKTDSANTLMKFSLAVNILRHSNPKYLSILELLLIVGDVSKFIAMLDLLRKLNPTTTPTLNELQLALTQAEYFTDKYLQVPETVFLKTYSNFTKEEKEILDYQYYKLIKTEPISSYLKSIKEHGRTLSGLEKNLRVKDD